MAMVMTMAVRHLETESEEGRDGAGAWADGSARRCCRLVAVHWPLRLPNPWAGLCPRADQLGWVAHCCAGELVLNYRRHRTASVRVVLSRRRPEIPRLLLCYTSFSAPATPRAHRTSQLPQPPLAHAHAYTHAHNPLHLVPTACRALPSSGGAPHQHPEANGKALGTRAQSTRQRRLGVPA
ncbi:hypothetical protein COCVIDRAFT_20574 [Bipolaris victoriae FI3]|uniref:Uncharacterized protein n=1 Tax=Bipolaris victoriae (strain FI3) TaxID=930091 RepID=W7DTY1_BIPV3|nr:hypothetical protein COCVIDRAFT_20574 [Bipolaris victoriae FI3]